MKKYKLNLFDDISIIFIFVMFAIVAITMSQVSSSICEQNILLVIIILTLFFVIFDIYIIINFFKIKREQYKSIAANVEKRVIVLENKYKQNIQISFDDIVQINVAQGEIIRGVSLGQIKIFTKDGRIFILTISNAIDFYCLLSKYLNIAINRSLFFKAE